MSGMREWERHQGRVLDSVQGFDVIDCEACGIKHIVPIPTPADLAEVYRNDYYTKEKPLYLQRYQEDLDWWNSVYAERYDTFEELLPASRRRILDVGSGPGYFLLHGRRRGWDVVGVEPSAQASAHSRGLGLPIVEDFLSSASAEALGSFDVVHLSEVLEHIPDPLALLEITVRLLTPGGLLCVVVPNDYNPFQKALRTECGFAPWWVAPPHHINFFSHESLSRLVERAGTTVVLQESTFPIDAFLLMGENYIGDDALGRQCHGKRKIFEKNLAAAGLTDLKRRLYRKLAECGLGREVFIVAKKEA